MIVNGATSQGIQQKDLGPAAKLIPLQNKCQRSITGAYRATSVKVLKAESGVIPLDTYPAWRVHEDQRGV